MTSSYNPTVDLIVLLILVLLIVAHWKIFVKADRPGWKSIVPFYNGWTMAEVSGNPGWWGAVLYLLIAASKLVKLGSNASVGAEAVALVLLIPALFFAVKIAQGIAKHFGKSSGFVFVLVFLPIIGYPMLAFGSDKYKK